MAGKYTWFDPAPDSTHNMVLGLVPERTRVLEFGCATGYVSAELTNRLGCTVTGVELSAEAAEEARHLCSRVIVGDAERLDLDAALGQERFDVILFADVLEHLREPAALLARVRRFLGDGGSVVASIPNVAHGSVRVALLQGEWRYRPLGLLDDTHLRFFTRDGVQDLFEGSGYVVTHWLRKRHTIEGTEMGVRVPPELEPHLARDPEVTTFQFIVRAVPSEAAHLVTELRRELAAAGERASATGAALEAARVELHSAVEQLGAARQELEGQRRVVEEQGVHLKALGAEIAALTARQTELRGLLLDAHGQLLERDQALREARARVETVEGEVRFMKSTKVWRLGTRYWRLVDRLRRARPGGRD